MEVKATEEQAAARDAFTVGHDLALVAGAGTGKTSTLVMMGSASRRRGMYIAFNKPIALEAKTRFGSNVHCSTSHALAYRAVGSRFQARLEATRHMPLWRTAQLLNLDRDLAVGSRRLKATTLAHLVMEMVKHFCYSTDEQVTARHLGTVHGLDDAGQQYVVQGLLPRARWAWDDICSPNGTLPFKHDHYLKMWALTRPRLRADYILLDEAQDTNPVLEEIFLAQQAQRVCVGDPSQQIYEWRHAKDIMSGFPGTRMELTQSFRFGPPIADVANHWLRAATSSMQLTGHAAEPSELTEVDVPDAVLCRGNADALAEVLRFLDRKVPVALVGGGKPLLSIAKAAVDLQAGRRTSHHDLALFSSWGEVQEYAEQDSAAADLKAIVDIVDTYGPHQIISTVQQMSDEEQARVVVSTVHKAKGREWNRVRIGPGFTPPDDTSAVHPALARLVYVAVTRARTQLDTAGIKRLQTRFTTATANTTPEGLPLARLPLTGQLKYPRSPMSSFLARHLPYPERLIASYIQHIQGLPHPVQPLNERRPDYAALGHTIDYRLRLVLGSAPGPAAQAGVDIIGSSHPIDGAPSTAVRQNLYMIGSSILGRLRAHLSDATRRLDDDELTRLCFVTSFFEAIYRNGTFPRKRNLLTLVDEHTTINGLTRAVPAYVLEDIDEQMNLAEKPFAPLRDLPAHQRVCGPTFTGSSDVHADADFITGGFLIDCKAVTRPHRLGRDEVQQLAGYLLLDYDNQYDIHDIGFYLARQGTLIRWTVPEFLTTLGARTPLPQLRTALRDHLRAPRSSRRN
ncbi:UvrD-helicase domain-containing protein [Streptomyces sp. NPDC052071]|uniref:UvrD-helicase domain-containing protein n=1 Tax=unclassified Streptomyces TaxID=2593676 RepID=UPI000AE44655|nr:MULTISPECIES: UvrD-helicase domain-containing protein [unclassified Streptomyces]MCY1655559.1 UvrD-helicase domain-containing protein [Streptomyces sp. SL203]MCY1676962.1 UvrD-helicase domain-containing protein [Streptomyces sp. SL294]